MQNPSGTHSELIQRSFGIHSEFIRNSCRAHSECILNSLRTYSELVLNSFRLQSEFSQDSFRIDAERIHNSIEFIPNPLETDSEPSAQYMGFSQDGLVLLDLSDSSQDELVAPKRYQNGSNTLR